MQVAKDVMFDCKTTVQACKKFFYYTVCPKQKSLLELFITKG